MLHPATLLVMWAGFALGLQLLAEAYLPMVSGVALVLALLFAQYRLRRLLWRSRWLFLSLAILFLFFTPGEYLPQALGRMGVTHEGKAAALAHVSLLAAMLASLAVLHESVGTRGLLSGLYALLHPLGMSQSGVVRMMLVLEFVEMPPAGGWRDWLAAVADDDGGNARLTLEMPRLHPLDRLLIALVCLGALVGLGMR
jgi:hypothetical protein